MNHTTPSRRDLLRRLAAGATLLTPGYGCARPSPAVVIIDDAAAGRPISPYIYGSNEIGTMDGGEPAAVLDARAGVAARRLGGNLMTSYNWTNNASNAGKDYEHSNGSFLLDALAIPKSEWSQPAAVIDAMLRSTHNMGAASLVTVPIVNYVAADMDGAASPAQAAPSRRFSAVSWAAQAPAQGVDMPQLLSLLRRRHGAPGAGGVFAYALDNEPGLWTTTHPRIVRRQPTIAAFIKRSLAVAAAIKSIDPVAKIFGPCCWGASEMTTFQDAPDWPHYQSYGNFLAAYLDAFRRESERLGVRLLDALDIHWYPFSNAGDLFRTEDPRLASALLAAPRSLSDPHFHEQSWVPDAFSGSDLRLPLLPALRALVDRWYPGVEISIGEFNYGGASLLASGLALADALGRFGDQGVFWATHWGSLAGWLSESYRLYRAKDRTQERFGAQGLPVEAHVSPELAAYAARSPTSNRLHLVVINKSAAPTPLTILFKTNRTRSLTEALGFGAAHPHFGQVQESAQLHNGALSVIVPPLAARRYVLE